MTVAFVGVSWCNDGGWYAGVVCLVVVVSSGGGKFDVGKGGRRYPHFSVSCILRF